MLHSCASGSGFSLGQTLPAVAVRKDGTGPREPVVLYFGIIDFLQEYNWRKRAEHAWKATVHDARAVSVCDSAAYSHRFQEFLTRHVFEEGAA